MQKSKNRAFLISCGLREGYDQVAPEHTPSEVRDLLGSWIETRMNAGKKILTGTLLTGEFIYPLNENGSFKYSSEPAINFKGQVREDATESDAEEMLSDLANLLANSLKQKRVHVEYGSEYWVLEI